MWVGSKQASIIIPSGIKPFPKPHELNTASALSRAGYVVEFISPDNRPGVKTADILLNGVAFEMKSPLGGMASVERNLKRASKQSRRVVFDSRRMKFKHSELIVRAIKQHSLEKGSVVQVIFIDRHSRVIELDQVS